MKTIIQIKSVTSDGLHYDISWKIGWSVTKMIKEVVEQTGNKTKFDKQWLVEDIKRI